jgi:HEAT repeat protein
MDLSLEKQDGEWYTSLPVKGAIYDLVDAARPGTDATERMRAVTALGKSDDPRAVRPLADLLEDEDPEIRLCATTALGLLKSGRPVDELIARLRDRNELPATRREAAAALSVIRSTGALRGLREFISDKDEDADIRTYAENRLRMTGLW